MKTIAVRIGLFVAALGSGCTSAPPPPAPESAAVTASVGTAAVGDIQSSFEAGGIVRARATAVIASRVMAPVAAVHVRAGDRVRRSAPLVTLDAREITANRTRASAALASATEAARAAESDTQAADASLLLTRATYERINTLHAKRSATAQELDQALAGLSAAEAQRAGAVNRVAAANAARDGARAAAEAAEIGVSYTILSAPFDGVVTERAVDPGSMAAPGVPLLTLEDTAMFRLEVQLDEARATMVRVGQAVDARVDDSASADAPWRAARTSEVARMDAASHSFLVKIELPADPALRSGLFGRARFPGPVRRALTVPASAVLRRGQLALLFMVDRDGVARLRPVTTGALATDRVEVLAGVRAGDRVVVNPPSALADGVRVTAIPEPPRTPTSPAGAGR
ncbi:MAG: efflux RND transporter periplasmic adaptor subunit [Acidobacteriota bacterium]